MSNAKNKKNDSVFWDAALQQKTFRKIMNAFAFPGTIETIIHADLQDFRDGALLLILATLADTGSSVADPYETVEKNFLRKLESPAMIPERAEFIVARGDVAPIFAPNLGSLESPETGSTIILRVGEIGRGDSLMMLRGPGIQAVKEVSFSGLDRTWLHNRQKWNAAFPMGVDMIIHDNSRLCAIPRSSHITIRGQ